MKFFRFLTLILFLVLTSCDNRIPVPPGVELFVSQVRRETQTEISDQTVKAIVNSNNQFAIDFYKQQVSNSDGNLVFSPYSISEIWAMLLEGADEKTAGEIAKVLHFDGQTPVTVHQTFNKVNLALEKINRQRSMSFELENSVWVSKDEGYQKNYLDILKRYYNTGLFGVDFKADSTSSRDKINSWIEKRTKGHFVDAIDRDLITSLTTLVLVNTIYFNNGWEFPFDPDDTKDAEFTLLDSTKKSVPMMNQKQKLHKFLVEDKYTALELQYKGNSFSMLIIMPVEGEFENIESELSSEFLIDISGKFLSGEPDIALPKFKIKDKRRLKENFKSMGIVSAFDGMDFLKIRSGGGMWVQDFVHGCYIDVNETGTEAAAVSAALMNQSVAEIIAIDHPFIFFITETDTDSILFMGRVLDPSV